MRDDLGDFAWLDTVIERQVQMRRHLDRLVARDQDGEGDDAPVAWGEARPFPHITEKAPWVYLSRAGATIRTSSGRSLASLLEQSSSGYELSPRRRAKATSRSRQELHRFWVPRTNP